MPIADIELVLAAADELAPGLAARLAAVLGEVFEAPAGRVWVRLRALPEAQYAENAAPLCAEELPAFVSLLLARPPEGAARAAQAAAVCAAVAQVIGRARERVHVLYAPPAAGRVAFGGVLLE